MDLWQHRDYSSIIQLALILLGAMAAVVILIAGISMTSKYAPQAQQQPLMLKVLSFSVSNFDVSDQLTAAIWDTELFFANQNNVLEISIQSFESVIYYNHSYPISCAVVKPIHLGPRRQKGLEVKFNSSQCGDEQPFVDDGVLNWIRKDEERGSVRFRIGMSLRVSYLTGFLSWNYELKPSCPDLRVKLGVTTRSGEDGPVVCSVTLPN